jgi:hypothetical protein
MKRLHILTKPTRVADLAEIEVPDYEDKWLLKAEKIEAKRLKRFRQQLAS